MELVELQYAETGVLQVEYLEKACETPDVEGSIGVCLAMASYISVHLGYDGSISLEAYRPPGNPEKLKKHYIETYGAEPVEPGSYNLEINETEAARNIRRYLFVN
jgi:hypothetical protein